MATYIHELSCCNLQDFTEIRDVQIQNDLITFNCKYGEITVSKYNSAFVHNFTISEQLNVTDVNLDNFTPDFVTDNEIIEFTTTEISNWKFLYDKLFNKIDKYRKLAEKHSKELKVFVISNNCILSNCEISNLNNPDDYIIRFNIANLLKKKMFLEFNLDLWSTENKQKFERILDSVLKNYHIVEPKDDFESSLNDKLPNATKNDLTYFVNECASGMVNFKPDLIDHTLDFELDGTRTDYKRVIPVSLLIPKSYDCRFLHRTDLLTTHIEKSEYVNHQLKLLDIAKSSIKISHDRNFELGIALEIEKVPEKRKKSMYRFSYNLTSDERIELSMFGVQAKKVFKDGNPEIIDKRKKDKESFNTFAPTHDIESFINSNTLINYEGYTARSISGEMYKEWSASLRTFKRESRDRTSLNEMVVLDQFEKYSNSLLIQYCKFIQALFTEINLSVRENLNNDVFIVKPIPGYNCDVYLKITGSMKPIFYFIVSNTDYIFADTTVGVKFKRYGSENLDISEWSSVKLRDVENYLAITSKMLATICYLKQIYDDDVILNKHLNYILLILLSNKDRDEELITILRYIYMRAVSFTDNVTTLVSKLPTFVRSRLNLFQVKRTLKLMQQLHLNKPVIKMIDGDRDIIGLFDIFNNSVNFKQALNFCYYGYIVNKSKQNETNQSSKLIDKILEYDLKINDGNLLSGVNKQQLADHLHDNKFLSVLCHFAELKIKQLYGDHYQEHFKTDFIKYMSKQNLISIATIKASAKGDLPNSLDNDSLKKLKKRRPKVTEALKTVIDDFGSFEHPIELVNYCIRQIDNDDCFNVELFSKDQHAGIREIYVVDIKVRIIQWFLESISRSLCKLFDSETMTNPSMKDYTSQKITRETILNINDPIMLCRSGDASKWSQTQNVTKFYQVLVRFLPESFHGIIKSILTLWFRKKIYLPASLIDVCLKSSAVVQNESINFIRDIYSGKITDKRLNKNQPFLRIRTGFMQGILHFTSSFFHTIVQEGFSSFKTMLVMKVFPEVKENPQLYTNIILQGSDDNSESIIVPKTLYNKSPMFFMMLVQLKDIMSHFVGIKVSAEKTASCAPFLMEYNSTWELAGKFVMPTIKFVFVSTDIPQKQTLIGRQEFYYSLLSNCLEKGCTLKTTCLIRLAQAEQHYLQLGYLHNLLFEDYIQFLKVNKSPALGYFMFEPTVICGLVGFDFMLYFHSIETEFSSYIQQEEKEIPTQILSNLGYKSIADYTISKFQFKRYNEIMENLKLGDVQKSRERINERPEALYSIINDKEIELDLINLKMHDFSVKESLSSRFSKSEMFSSLIYILSRPVCYFNRKKNSLIKLCKDLNENSVKTLFDRSKIKKTFTRSKQYDQLIDDIRPIVNSNIFIDQTYIQRGSSRIQILEGLNEDSYKLLDLCKAKWFNIKNIPIDDNILNKYFRIAKVHIPWLKDTENETKEGLNCDSFQLYYYLMNSFKDAKYVKLLDTPGKRGNIKYLITRIADVNKKLVYIPSSSHIREETSNMIKSNIKFICDYPFSLNYKKEILIPILNEFIKTDMRFNEKQTIEMILSVLLKDENKFYKILYDNSESLNLVIFTKPQKFDDVTGKWFGDGIILCKSGSLIFELKINDSLVTMIAVNRIDLARSRTNSIIKVVKELKLKFMGMSDHTLKLNASGIKMDRIGTKIIEIPELSFNLSNLKNLDVTIEHNRIKVVTRLMPKELNNETLMDDLEEIDMALVKNNLTNIREWIPDYKVGKGDVIIERCKMLQKFATQTITLCSLKSNRYFFNNQDKAMFNIDKLAKFFWSQESSIDNLIILINDIMENYSIKDSDDFRNKHHLDNYSISLFKRLLLGKQSSRDELIVRTDEVTEEESIDPNYSFDTLFGDIFSKSTYDIFTSLIDDNLVKNLTTFDDALMNFVSEHDEIVDDFVKNLAKCNKSFYLQYSSNTVLDQKIFETLFIKLNCMIPNVESIFEKDFNTDSLSYLIKNVLICLFGLKSPIGRFDNKQIEIDSVNLNDQSFSDIIQDENLIRTILQMSQNEQFLILKKYLDCDDNQIELDEIIQNFDIELNHLRLMFEKQKSIAMKKITSNRINAIEKHSLVLIELKKILIGAINLQKEIKENERKLIEEEANRKTQENMKLIEIQQANIDSVLSDDNIIDFSKLTFLSGRSNVMHITIPEISEFEIVDVPGDGSCLFYAMQHCMASKNSDYAMQYWENLREEIVQTIKRFSIVEMIKVIEGEDYPDRLLEKKQWGDLYCMVAYGHLTNSQFCIIEDGNCVGLFGCKQEECTKVMYLERVFTCHFKALILKTDFDNYKFEFDELMGFFEVIDY